VAGAAGSDLRSSAIALEHCGLLPCFRRALAAQSLHGTKIIAAMRRKGLTGKHRATNGETRTASPIPLQKNVLWHSQSAHATGHALARVAFVRWFPGGQLRIRDCAGEAEEGTRVPPNLDPYGIQAGAPG